MENTANMVNTAMPTEQIPIGQMPVEQVSKLSALQKALESLLGAAPQPFALAYSGGLDSRFLAFAATHLGYAPQLFHVTGPHIPQAESAYAKDFALRHSLPYQEFFYTPLGIEAVRHTHKDRCYHCKNGLFTFLKTQTSLPLADGSHSSDTQSYRPGTKALQEHGVYSPLALAGLEKQDIRNLAASLGMEQPNQAARPCLLTRFAYNLEVQEDTLRILEQAEAIIHAHLSGEDFRLRVLPEGLELHTCHPLPDSTHSALTAALPFAFVCRVLPTLSGYFDTLTP